MLFNTLTLILASALTLSAHPAANQLTERGGGSYTCGDAWNDCQGSGQGNWVCWADNKSKTCGKWGGTDMMKNKDQPLSNYCKGKAYCCKNDAIVDIDIDIDVLGLIDINVEVQLQQQCQGRQIWGE